MTDISPRLLLRLRNGFVKAPLLKPTDGGVFGIFTFCILRIIVEDEALTAPLLFDFVPFTEGAIKDGGPAFELEAVGMLMGSIFTEVTIALLAGSPRTINI
jgi:hypothetical protein